MFSKGIRHVLGLLAMLFFGGVCQAQPTFVTSLDQLQFSSTVTWGAIGFNGQSFGGPQYLFPVPGLTNTGLTITGPDQIFGGFSRINQGGGWSGSFNAGEELIWSNVDGSFRFDFWNTQTGEPAPVAGFGARYQDSIPGPFAGTLSGFDAADNMLFRYELSGVTQNGDPLGSAPFFGALSDERNISYLRYTDLTTGAPLGQQGFALGTFYVQENPYVPVPEPASLLLIATTALGVWTVTRRKRKSPPAPLPKN
jgi:hypothetical protein